MKVYDNRIEAELDKLPPFPIVKGRFVSIDDWGKIVKIVLDSGYDVMLEDDEIEEIKKIGKEE